MITPTQVSIIIPAFNEEMIVGHVVQRLRAKFPQAELFVVDDGSTDQTGKIAAETGAQVIRHDACHGYGAALRTGTLASTREYVLFCDGDGQHSADDVGCLMENAEGYDMVVGSRDKASHAPLLRAPGKFVLRHFANYLAGQIIPDLNSGLRMIRRAILLKYLHLMPAGFSFSTTSTFALLKGNYRIKWVPITVQKRTGKSMVRQWKHGPQTMLLMIRLTVLFEPLKVFLTVAGGLGGLCIISLGLDFFTNPTNGIGDVTVLLSLAALLVFMFGLVCDQIAALRRELHD
jgi:glycosyltransferase involved in cell wall biosynthesis